MAGIIISVRPPCGQDSAVLISLTMTAIRPHAYNKMEQTNVLNFAANLSFMFNEWSFLDRFAAAADAGFTAVEYLFPYEFAPDAIATALQKNKLTQALFNFYPGDFSGGDRGLAALPAREKDFTASIDQALTYAKATGVKRLHLMAGLADAQDPALMAHYRRVVRRAAEALAAE